VTLISCGLLGSGPTAWAILFFCPPPRTLPSFSPPTKVFCVTLAPCYDSVWNQRGTWLLIFQLFFLPTFCLTGSPLDFPFRPTLQPLVLIFFFLPTAWVATVLVFAHLDWASGSFTFLVHFGTRLADLFPLHPPFPQYGLDFFFCAGRTRDQDTPPLPN